MATSVITFSDAALVERLQQRARPGESVSLAAKRLLNDALDALDADSSPEQVQSIETALESVEQLGDLLRYLRGERMVR